MRSREWNGTCQRCYEKVSGHIMSMFNMQLICLDCSDKETKRDDFSKAQDADAEAINQGDYNFKGIGLDKETKRDDFSKQEGDGVFWNDPDDGLCSAFGVFVRYLTNNAALIVKDGIEIEVFRKELS
jgi:hypothetical protein